MILSAYLDGFRWDEDPPILIDATGRLRQPACWPALLYSVGGAPAAAEAFEIDRADLDSILSEMQRADQWPVFHVELADGYQVHLIWRNYKEDAGWDYLLTHSGSGKMARIASLEGCFQGPALSWPELIVTSRFPDRQLSPAERLLMLLPAMADTSMPSNAGTIVADAVAAVGGYRLCEEVATELLAANHRFWGPTEWRENSDGVKVCLGGYSIRRIDGPWADRQLLSAALAKR